MPPKSKPKSAKASKDAPEDKLEKVPVVEESADETEEEMPPTDEEEEEEGDTVEEEGGGKVSEDDDTVEEDDESDGVDDEEEDETMALEPEAAAKPKITKKAAANGTYIVESVPVKEVLMAAIASGDKKKGISLMGIKKYVEEHHPDRDWNRAKLFVKKAILKGLENETIVRSAKSKEMNGVTGFFKINPKPTPKGSAAAPSVKAAGTSKQPKTAKATPAGATKPKPKTSTTGKKMVAKTGVGAKKTGKEAKSKETEKPKSKEPEKAVRGRGRPKKAQ